MKNFYLNNKDSNLLKLIDSNFNLNLFLKLVLTSIFLITIFFNLKYASQPLLEAHQFRQTQTALTAYYLQKDGFHINYETPVVGQSWSIPFEFPIYQEIVSIASSLFNTPIAETGRLISLFLFLITSIPLFKSLSLLEIPSRAIFFSLAIVYTCPFYLFWSGTFLIESAALLFTVCFIYYSVLIIKGNNTNRNIFLLSLFLLLALLQKITTVLPILLIMSVIFLMVGFTLSELVNNKLSLIKILIAVLLPLLISFFWIKYSDNLKMSNPIAIGFTSEALRGWNFGNLQQRLSKNLWANVIYGRNIFNYGYGLFGFALLCFAILNIKSYRSILLILLLFFISHFLIFTNLHIVHDYYQFSNYIYFILALSLSIALLSDKYLINYKFIYCLILISFIATNFSIYFEKFYPIKSAEFNENNNKTLQITNFIKLNTPSNSTVVWYGFDWSSEAAFYSERKSLTVPSWGNLESDTILNTRKYLGNQMPSAFVICPSDNLQSLIKLLDEKFPSVKPKKINDCFVYLVD